MWCSAIPAVDPLPNPKVSAPAVEPCLPYREDMERKHAVITAIAVGVVGLSAAVATAANIGVLGFTATPPKVGTLTSADVAPLLTVTSVATPTAAPTIATMPPVTVYRYEDVYVTTPPVKVVTAPVGANDLVAADLLAADPAPNDPTPNDPTVGVADPATSPIYESGDGSEGTPEHHDDHREGDGDDD